MVWHAAHTLDGEQQRQARVGVTGGRRLGGEAESLNAQQRLGLGIAVGLGLFARLLLIFPCRLLFLPRQRFFLLGRNRRPFRQRFFLLGRQRRVPKLFENSTWFFCTISPLEKERDRSFCRRKKSSLRATLTR